MRWLILLLLLALPAKLVRSGARLPDFQAGYVQWKSAHGGVFDLPVAAIVAGIAKTLQQP